VLTILTKYRTNKVLSTYKCEHLLTLTTVRSHAQSSAKNYYASGALPLRQDTRWANLAPLTLGAPDAVLPLSLTPGTSGGTVAIQTYLWTLVAPQPYIPYFRTQLTTPSYLPIHYSFIQPPEYHLSISCCGFPAIPPNWKGGTLGTNDWVSNEATICFILILHSG